MDLIQVLRDALANQGNQTVNADALSPQGGTTVNAADPNAAPISDTDTQRAMLLQSLVGQIQQQRIAETARLEAGWPKQPIPPELLNLPIASIQKELLAKGIVKDGKQPTSKDSSSTKQADASAIPSATAKTANPLDAILASLTNVSNPAAPLVNNAGSPDKVSVLTGKDKYVQDFNTKSQAGQFDASAQGIQNGASSNRVVASKQANGNVSFTNIGTPMQPAPLTGTSASELASADNVTKAISALAGKSEMEVAQGIEAIKTAGANTIMTMEQDALAKARILANLPGLQASLVKAQAADSALAARGVPASQLPNAKGVLVAIENANKLADSMATRELGSNVTYMSIKSKIDNLGKDTVLGVIGKDASESANMAKADKVAYDSLPADAQANYKRAFPDKAKDGTSLVAAGKKLPRDEQEALTQPAGEVLLNAIANPANATANKIVSTIMQEDGVDSASADNRLKEMHRIMADPKEFSKIASKLVPKDQLAQFTNATVGMKAEDKKNLNMLKANIVIQHLDNQATQAYAVNPTSALLPFASVDPALKKAIEDAPSKDLSTIAKLYIGEDYATGMVKKNALAGYIKQSIQGRKKTLVGNVDSEVLLAELPMVMKQSRLGEWADRIPRGAGVVYDNVASTPLGQLATGEIKAASDAWNWLTNPETN